MEQFIVSARKYRPQTFEEVVGQQAITNTLVNAIQSNHLAQALLFTGPRGVGKTTCARILARKINQPGYDDPKEDFAFNVFELDAASNNSVDDIRNLIDQVRIPPQTGKYKVYIIDEVHMLSSAAFNAFLKTLEEPPAHAIFILATTEKHKIIPTILSRCQIFDFKRITISDAANHLALVANSQGIRYEPEALHIIAQKADGAMRDALSIFDRVVSYCGANLTRQAVAENLNVLDFEYYIQITDMILQGNIPGLLSAYEDILAKGFDGHHFIAGLASHFRNLMVVQNPQTASLLEVGEHGRNLYVNQSQKTNIAFLLQAMDMANDCDLKYKASQNQRLLVELCLMQLASFSIEGEKKDKFEIISPQRLNEVLSQITPSDLQLNKPLGHTNGDLVNSNLDLAKNQGLNNNQTVDQEIAAVQGQEQVQDLNQNTLATSIGEKKVARVQVNALSLSSIRKKRELENSLEKRVVDLQDLPKEHFTLESLMQLWNQYAERLSQNGMMLMASLMGMTRPVLNGSIINLELPNQGSKISFDENKYDLVNFLRKKLNNYDIEIHIVVNEQIKVVSKVMNSKDKYQHFTQLNPQIENLRQVFDLELK